MRALGVVGLVKSQLQRYPVEALESICHSVRGDELDARRAPHAPHPAAGVAVAWCTHPFLCIGDTTSWHVAHHDASRACGAGTRRVLCTPSSPAYG